MFQQRGKGGYGLQFMNSEKAFFTLRQIQNAYDRAFAGVQCSSSRGKQQRYFSGNNSYYAPLN